MVAAITVQLIEMTAALLLIAVLFLMGKRRRDSFMIKGDVKAQSDPIRWLRQKSPSPLWRFGLAFTLIVIASQAFMFIIPIHPSTGVLGKMIPFIPLILLLAASNGFNEENNLRVSPSAPVYEVVGKSNVIWMAAILFGLAHYISGIWHPRCFDHHLPGLVLWKAPGRFKRILLGGFFHTMPSRTSCHSP